MDDYLIQRWKQRRLLAGIIGALTIIAIAWSWFTPGWVGNACLFINAAMLGFQVNIFWKAHGMIRAWQSRAS